MAVTLTSNFDLSKHDRGDDWLATMNTNMDDIDALLKSITLASGVAGILRVANNTSPAFVHKARNDGTGFDYVSTGKSQFADIETALIEDPSNPIEIRPNGVTANNGLKIDVSGGLLRMTTGQASGFHLIDTTRITDLDFQTSGSLILIGVATDIGFEFRGGTTLTNKFSIKPAFNVVGSIEEALAEGGIKKIHHIDYEITNVLGLFATKTIIIYGE